MPSAEHNRKVAAIFLYFQNNSISKSCADDWLIMIDHNPNFDSPGELDGARPDFLAHSRKEGRIVIGEAKTSADFRTERSTLQIKKFLNWNSNIHLSIQFILCVPLDQISEANILLKSSSKNPNTSTVIIDELSQAHGNA